MYFLLSRTQAGPGRTVKQEQEVTSRNHVQTFSGCSVVCDPRRDITKMKGSGRSGQIFSVELRIATSFTAITVDGIM